MYFTTNIKVNYFDCDLNNRLKMSAALKYMQQTSSVHLGSLGFSPEQLFDQGLVFLLTKMNIKVHRMPACNEELVVGTAAIQPRGVRFYREFIIETTQGERLLSGLSLWVLVVPATRKIIRPTDFPYPIQFQEPSLAEIISDVTIPKNIERGNQRADVDIRYSHIDVNHHVNNTVYADFICDALPFDQLVTGGIDTLILSFQHEAKLGERLEIATTTLSPTDYYVSGLHRGSTPCFEALVTMTQQE